MVIISTDGPKNPKDQANNPEEENLTPWQKANQAYMEEKGKDPLWSPKVIDGKPTEEAPDSEDEAMTVDEALKNGEDYQGLPRTDSFADRLPKIKYQRSSVMYRRLILIICLLLIPLIGAIYYVSPLSKLASVTVSGNQKVASETVVKSANFTIGEGLWGQYQDRSQNEAEIKKANPRVKSVALGIQHFNQFHLTVTEFKEVALLAKDNKYSTILENGYVLPDQMEKPKENMPVLEGFTSEKLILTVLKNYQSLSQEIREGISQIKSTPSKSNPELLTLYMNDRNQVIVNISNMDKQMAYYPQVAKDMKEKGVIDMEVGIYSYPYKDEKDEEDASEDSQSANSEQNVEAQADNQ